MENIYNFHEVKVCSNTDAQRITNQKFDIILDMDLLNVLRPPFFTLTLDKTGEKPGQRSICRKIVVYIGI